MKSRPVLDIARWAHYTWLGRTTPPRNERARAETASQLPVQFALLSNVNTSQPPTFAAPLTRPVCVRLLRLCAALSRAHSLRLVVSGPAHKQLLLATGLPPLTQLQSHPRGAFSDMTLDAPVDFFNRHSLNVMGLAIALRASDGDVQRLWMQLRMPRDWAEAAARLPLASVSPHAAQRLIDDARSLLADRSTPC